MNPPIKDKKEHRLSKYWKSKYGDIKYLLKNAIPLKSGQQLSKEYAKQRRLKKKGTNK